MFLNSSHTPRKRFGQNFLRDEYVISKIVEIVDPTCKETIVEIGPGLGSLTKPLLQCVDELHVVELDRDIVQFLKENFANCLVIHESDALKFDFLFFNRLIRVVGNLPYNISTPLLFHVAKYSNVKDMHFMLQKEVVDRICALPDSKDYGKLTIMLQYKFKCHKMLDVGRECFYPTPKVNSAIVRLVPKNSGESYVVEERKLSLIVTQAFNQRRKTIQNSLKTLVSPDIFEKLEIDVKKRAENLTISEYINLANII